MYKLKNSQEKQEILFSQHPCKEIIHSSLQDVCKKKYWFKYIGFAWIYVVHTFGFNSHSWISGRQLSRKKGTYKETRIYCKTLYKNVFALKLWFMMAAIWQGKHNKSDLKKLKIFFLTWFWYYRP